jgi:hypothetical protein
MCMKPRRWTLIATLALCGAAMVSHQARAAQSATESAAQFMEPMLTQRQFTALCQQLALTHEQRTIAEMLFADYAADVEGVAAAADARADAAGRQTVLAAFAGRMIVDAEELRRLRLAVLAVYEETWPEADRLLADLYAGLRSILGEDQRPRFGAAMVQLRREMLLHPRHAGRQSYEYAGDGVDVLLLIDEAKKPGGELEGLPPAAIAETRAHYEQQLDALLIESAPEQRRIRSAMRAARIRRDADTLHAAEREALEHWRRLYDLNERIVRAIGAVAEAERGEEARERWMSRFDQACFPWLFAADVPQRQRDFLARMSLTEAQRAEIDAAFAEHTARRRELLAQAIDLMLVARRELQCMVYPMMDPTELPNPLARGVYEQLLKNSGEIAALESAAADRIEAALTEHERTTLRRAVRRTSAPRR